MESFSDYEDEDDLSESESEQSDSDSDSDEDFVLDVAKKQKIDPESRVKEKSIKRTNSGFQSSFATHRDVKGESQRKGNHVTTKVTGMKKLPPGHRAPTDPAPDHITLHSDKKGSGGKRKYNPNDQVSAHLGGMATFGVPATKGLGMSLDASPIYNRLHLQGHEKELLDTDKKKGARTWDAMSQIELEDPSEPARLQELENNSNVTKERAAKRILTAKKKSPNVRAIKKFTTDLESSKQEKIHGEYERDYAYLAKDKWFKDSYDPDNSSGDEDIEKGEMKY